MPKRTWKVRISLEEKGETSYSTETLGATELSIPGDYPVDKVGQLVAVHADTIIRTARETRPDSPVLADAEI